MLKLRFHFSIMWNSDISAHFEISVDLRKGADNLSRNTFTKWEYSVEADATAVK